MKKYALAFSILCCLALLAGCGVDEPKDVIKEDISPLWNPVAGFEKMDIRYIVKNENTLYLSAIDLSISYSGYGRGKVFKTTDGQHWTTIGVFSGNIGPITLDGDTLYMQKRDTIFTYTEKQGWKYKYPVPGRLAEPELVSDMAVVNGEVYVTIAYANQLETYVFHRNGTYELYKFWGGTTWGFSKFLKYRENGVNFLACRPNWITVKPVFLIDLQRSSLTFLENGLSHDELYSYSQTNSMRLRNDTLFAAYKEEPTHRPSVIKYWTGSTWAAYTDPLPYSFDTTVTKIMVPETISIEFAGGRTFASTQCLGVAEWVPGKGWKEFSSGLIANTDREEGTNLFFIPITNLEYFKGYLFAGYGVPAFAPWGKSHQKSGLFYTKIQ